MIVSRFRTALDLDTYPLRNLIRPRCAERAKNLVEVSQCSLSYWLFSLFSRHISRTQSFQQNRHVIFPALVALKLLVSLISRLVACSARIVVDTHTHTLTHTQTHRTTTVTLAAHAQPRVNYNYCTYNIFSAACPESVCMASEPIIFYKSFIKRTLTPGSANY